MRGLKFVNLVSEQAALQKQLDESMHASHTSLSPPSLTSHLFRAINFTIHIHNTHRARKRWQTIASVVKIEKKQKQEEKTA